jgi:hypothetical protein
VAQTNISRLLTACRVPDGQFTLGEFGPWELKRIQVDTLKDPTGEINVKNFAAACVRMNGCRSYHVLTRMTEAKMHVGGDIVMIDNLPELQKHLPILMRAAGRVLITGLGLGCVVRGLLSKPDVEHIDVVEIDRQILDRIGPEFSGNSRVTLHHADAMRFKVNGRRWDWAWHDLWDEHEALAIVHSKLIFRLCRVVRHQGAWEMPRWLKRRWGGEFFVSTPRP